MNHLLIDVKHILEAVGNEEHLKKAVELQPLEKDKEKISFAEPVELDLTLSNIGSGILVKGRVAGKMKLACSRCLCDLNLPAGFEVEDLYTSESPEEEKLRITADSIDLGPAIDEGFIVEIPIAPLCDAACKGLCPVCGGNLNAAACRHEIEQTDQRLLDLKKWLERQEKREG